MRVKGGGIHVMISFVDSHMQSSVVGLDGAAVDILLIDKDRWGTTHRYMSKFAKTEYNKSLFDS